MSTDPLAQLNEELRSRHQDNPGNSRWLPLESNPEMFTQFAQKLGLPDDWEWTDVLGFEHELLEMVPKPVAAAVLLFPCTDSIYTERRREENRLRASGRKADELAGKVFYLQQIPEFGNACGTIACIHALSNSQHHFDSRRLVGDSPLCGFLAENAQKSPAERGKALVYAESLKEQSDSSASDIIGQTVCPDRDAKLDHHFVAFTRMILDDGEHLLELDGTKWAPIDHGLTSEKTFLDDVAAVVQKNFIAFGEGSPYFAMMALIKKQ